jgi:hypothetical protein
VRRQEPPVTAFRRRLLRLIEEQDAGQYTTLARRAGIPTTTMEHYIHNAKHLPGGEHLLKLATALGVTVYYRATGEAPPAGEWAAEPRIAPTPRGVPVEEVATHFSIPLFACGCPGHQSPAWPHRRRFHLTLVRPFGSLFATLRGTSFDRREIPLGSIPSPNSIGPRAFESAG